MINPKPFIKSAGGKTRLLPILRERVRQSKFTGKYHEIFLGGGALFFDLYSHGLLGKQKAFLSDACHPISATWSQIKHDPSAFLASMEQTTRGTRNTAENYKDIRNIFNDNVSTWQYAALFVWLNHVCYNGLTRFSAAGNFNTPFGKYTDPHIYDKENILACAKALKKAQVRHEDYVQALERAQAGDVIYVDPPYDGQFDQYTPKGFGKLSQISLAACLHELHNKGIKIIASNSNTRFIRRLYKDFMQIETVYANTKSINSNTEDRSARSELLMCNFDTTKEN